MKKIFIFSVVLCFAYAELHAQGSEVYGKGITLNVDTSGKRYIRFITWHQIWARYVDNNPGTLVNTLPEAGTWDIGLRRSRLLWYTQVSPKFLVLMHIGINNQTFVNGGTPGGTATPGANGPGKKPQLFIHDAWTEYMVVKDRLYLGTGLHYWNGISRLGSSSTLNFLSLDAPIFNWPLVEESDQFVRQFGIYAKGKIPIATKTLNYRAYLNKPFATPNPDNLFTGSPGRAFATANNTGALGGYFSFEFLESESNVLPFFVGTYLGTKKVFNIGGGFHYHPQATKSFDASQGKFDSHNMSIFGIDSFLDLPINKQKGTALTAYALYQNMDFGPNYARSIGIMNVGTPAAQGALLQGAGNAEWRIGTGSAMYGEIGYLLPRSTIGLVGRLQPFATLTYYDFEFLADPSVNYGVGLNYYLDGHHAKVSFKYQTRSLYKGNFNSETGERPGLNDDETLNGGAQRASEFIVQTMIYL